jgi:hypothetical protein
VTTKSKLQAYLTIIAWNIYIGTSVKDARKALRDFRIKYQPEIFALMEATNLYGDLHGLGYEVIQLKPRALRKGSRPGQGNIAILVHQDLKIRGRYRLKMSQFWKGPKHGWSQDPRVYRWVKVEWQGKVWKIGAAHTPFGSAARTESRNRLIKWLLNTLPKRPTVLVLDANMRLDEFDKTIAEPGGAESSGTGIDLEAHKNCELAAQTNLGKGVSDHPAKKYEFTAN